jgi:hypothetical protein
VCLLRGTDLIFICSLDERYDYGGRNIALGISARSLTAEARVRSQVSPCEICGGQSGNETSFSP